MFELATWFSHTCDKATGFAKYVIEEGVGAMEDICKCVSAVAPRHEHIISDTKFNRSHARTHILTHKSKAQATEITCKMGGLVREIETISKEFGLVEFLSNEKSPCAEAWERTVLTFNSGVIYLYICAGLAVLDTSVGQNRLDKAQFVITEKSDRLPTLLRQEVEKLIA